MKIFFFKMTPYLLLWLILAAAGERPVFSQSDAHVKLKQGFCDERLRMNLKVGTVSEIAVYKKAANDPPMTEFTKDKIKYKTKNIVKFQMFDLRTGEQKTEVRAFYNAASENLAAVKFQVGQKYLFEASGFYESPRTKGAKAHFFIGPKNFVKLFADAAEDIAFLKSAADSDKYREIFGTDEGEAITAGVVSGKATRLVKPAYPDELKKKKISESISVFVLIDEIGGVIRAKALCAENEALAAAAEQAALASKFSPTLIRGRPVKVKGVIVYNLGP